MGASLISRLGSHTLAQGLTAFESQTDRIEFSGGRREHAALAEPLAEAIADALIRGDGMLLGPIVERFELQIATDCARRFAVGVGSGTDALFIALKSLGLGPGDEVLTPDMSFIATAAAVFRTGARPVFVDIDQACNLDLDRATARITRRTKAIVFVQLLGGMGDPERIEAFAKEHQLHLVEDAAQSFGARFAGRPSGSVGVISALSFDPMKVVGAPTTAGAVLTDDPDLAARFRRLRYHGREEGEHVEVGLNSQLASLSAAVLLVKLQHHHAWSEKRRRISAYYRAALETLPVWFPTWSPSVFHNGHKFIFQTPRRDNASLRLADLGVPTKVHYRSPFHREPLFKGSGLDADFPNACTHADHTLSLPIHAFLTDAEVDHITESVRACLG